MDTWGFEPQTSRIHHYIIMCEACALPLCQAPLSKVVSNMIRRPLTNPCEGLDCLGERSDVSSITISAVIRCSQCCIELLDEIVWRPFECFDCSEVFQ